MNYTHFSADGKEEEDNSIIGVEREHALEERSIAMAHIANDMAHSGYCPQLLSKEYSQVHHQLTNS